MKTNNYRVLIKVAETGNITRAAEELNYSQPNISHIISNYEKETGCHVFTRARDNITLTDTGKILYNFWSKIVNNEDALLRYISQINELENGTIKIGALASTMVEFLPLVIEKFSKTYPGIKIQLYETAFENIDSQLINGSIDIAFVSKVNIKKLEFIPLYHDGVVLIMNKEHPLAAFEEVSLAQLSGCSLIQYTDNIVDLTGKKMDAKKYKPVTNIYVDSDTAAISMVEKNLGVYILPSSQLALLSRNISYRKIVEEEPRELGIAIKSSNATSPLVKKMIEIAKIVSEDFSVQVS